MQKRRSSRITRRLEIKFASNDVSFKGITSNVSKEGLFVRTLKGFPPGTLVKMELHLPSGKHIKRKGVVKRTLKTNFSGVKNGIGIEFIDTSTEYEEFLKAHE